MAATCACSKRSATHRKGIVPHGACPNFSEPPDESAFNVDKRFKTLLEVKGFMQPYITAQDSAVDAAANDRNHCPGVRMCGLLKRSFLSDWKTFPCGQKKCPSCSSINGVKICPICDTMYAIRKKKCTTPSCTHQFYKETAFREALTSSEMPTEKGRIVNVLRLLEKASTAIPVSSSSNTLLQQMQYQFISVSQQYSSNATF